MTDCNDPDWLRIFGTTSTQLEKPPKPPAKPRKLKLHQREAAYIVANPGLFRPETDSDSADIDRQPQ